MTMQNAEPLMAAGHGPGGGPSGYGMPPPGAPGGYGAPPGGYGGPPGGGGPGGGPTGGYGAVPAQPPHAPGGAPKKGKGGLIAGIVVALVALGGAGVAGWYFWLNSTGPDLAKWMPKDTELYVESPSLLKGLVSFVDIDFVDEAELDSGKTKTDAIEGMSEAFDIKKEEAETVLKSVKSVALGLRNMDEKPEGAFLMSFSSAGDVEPLLKSKRFDKGDSLAGGTKYKLTKREVDADELEKMNAFEKAFSEMGSRKKDKDDEDDEDDDKKKSACVFWEDKALFACGDVDYLENMGKVLTGDKENLLKDNEKFAAAKWPGKSSLLVYFDSSSIKDEDVRKGFFADGAPILGSMRFTDAGVVLQAKAELSGKKLPSADLYPEAPPDLTLSDRLPGDTVAYVAFSTKTKGSYKDYEKSLVKQLEDADEDAGKQFEKMIEKMDDEVGFTLETIYDAMGDEGILAFTATDKVDWEMIEKKDKDALDELGLVIAVHVKDEEKANKIIKNLREKVEEKAKDAVEIKKTDTGFVATPKIEELPLPSASVTIEDGKYLVVAVGKAKKRMEAIKSAFSGEGDSLLKDDKAHTKAKKALSGKNWGFFWVDTGRLLKVALKGNKEIKEKAKEQGFNVSAIVTEGENRITSATAIRMDLKDDKWIIEVEDLNGALGSIGGAAALASFSRAAKFAVPDEGDDPLAVPTPSNSGSLPVIGVASCDEYITKMQKCIKTMPASTQTAMEDSLKKSADAWKQAAATPAARSALESGCKSAVDSIKQMPGCN